ncbi:hypothetical protein K474DRAFT_1699100 [Panus rudis PR-1116 ss-1]|nr:hypothetical protein K474DRAFT_1699100 [Panus rudis PR-1116 ss-1]
MTKRSSQPDLTTSRIIRLLRPLRTKCAAASISASVARQHRHKAIVTYASRTNNSNVRSSAPEQDDVFSLTILPPAERMNSLKYSREQMMASKQMYDVRDAFRNLVQAVLGGSNTAGHDPPTREIESSGSGRILSLAGMCSMIIGRHIESEVAIARENREEDDGIGGEEDMEVVTDLYEAMPSQCRENALIAHAMSLILSMCPHHPTLLTILLDITMSYNLPNESEMLLSALLTAVVTPSSPNNSPPISTSTQSKYLTNLHERCCKAKPRSSGGGRRFIFNDRAFARILGEAIMEAGICAVDVWSSPAMVRLVKSLRAKDFGSFANLCAGIVRSMATLSAPSRISAKGEGKSACSKGVSPFTVLLVEHASQALNALVQRSKLQDVDPPSDEMDATIHFLDHAASVGLHHSSSGDDIAIKLNNILTCLALWCLVSSPNGVDNVLLTILRESPTSSTMYEPLLNAYYPTTPPTPNESPIKPQSAIPSLSILQSWVSRLRAHALFSHEAALWSSTLRHIENMAFATPGDQTYMPLSKAEQSRLTALRVQLVDLVEEAERLQCRQASSSSSSPSTSSSSSVPSPRAEVLETDEEWRWEDIVGCWIKKTPLVPKTRVFRNKVDVVCKKRKRNVETETDASTSEDTDDGDDLDFTGSPMHARKNQSRMTQYQLQVQVKKSSLEEWTAKRSWDLFGRPQHQKSDGKDGSRGSTRPRAKAPSVASSSRLSKTSSNYIATAPPSSVSASSRITSSSRSSSVFTQRSSSVMSRNRQKPHRDPTPDMIPLPIYSNDDREEWEEGDETMDASASPIRAADRISASSTSTRPRPAPRLSFNSILADAQMNREVLHPKRLHPSHPPKSVQYSRHSNGTILNSAVNGSSKPPKKRPSYAEESESESGADVDVENSRPSSSSRYDYKLAAQMSSDDALDLFNYPSSP